jgi:membrane-associated phospholipid phosphatase
MPHKVRRPLLASLACIAAIGVLAWAVEEVGALRRLDLRTVMHFEDSAAISNTIANVLVHPGDPAGLLCLAAGIVAVGVYLGRRREVIAALVVIAGANLTTQVLKAALENNRHAFQESGLDTYLVKGFPTHDSFPSGHTTAAASIAVAALFVVPAQHRMTAAAVGLLLTAAVGISVLVLDWHYPTDVLGGLLVVAAWGFATLAGLRLWPSASSTDDPAPSARHPAAIASRD